jgi:hypothetical protein
MIALSLLAAAALAGSAFEDEEEEVKGFFLDSPRFRLTAEAWPAPTWSPAEGERVCAMTLIARDGGIVVEKFECPDALLVPVTNALATWKWSTSAPVPAGTALLRLSFLFPTAADPRTATFVWPLVSDGRLTSVPPDVVELRADRRCGATTTALTGTPPAHPVTCQATVRLDWLAKPSLVAIADCPERVRDLVETRVQADYKGLCPTGRFGVPTPSEFTTPVTVDEGIFHPEE